MARAREPIHEGRPSGDDISFDPAFEVLTREVEKLERVDSARPDWTLIEEQADKLLTTRTKDFRLAVWTAAAKAHRRKWEGLAEGLSFYGDLVAGFWDSMFPPAKRARARANLHEWLLQRVILDLEDAPAGRVDEASLVAAQGALEELDRVLEERLGDLFSGSNRLRALLRRRIQELPPPTPPPPPPPPTPPPPPPTEMVSASSASAPQQGSESGTSGASNSVEAAAPVAPQPVVPQGPTLPPTDDPRACITACVDLLSECAGVLAERDGAIAEAYRLRRIVEALRQSLGSGALDFTPPDADRRAGLAQAVASGDDTCVMTLAEQAMIAHPAWLDPYRLSVEALSRLGPRFAEMRSLVEGDAVATVVRNPLLLERRFRDGAPACDPLTKEWLQGTLRQLTGAGAVVTTVDEEAERHAADVQQMAVQGRVTDAIALAVRLANTASNARGRFRGMLLAGKTALDRGHVTVARALLEGLITVIERHQLEMWEPDLCVAYYALLLTCLRAISGAREGAESSDRERDLFDRLCKLDPAAAMRLGGTA